MHEANIIVMLAPGERLELWETQPHMSMYHNVREDLGKQHCHLFATNSLIPYDVASYASVQPSSLPTTFSISLTTSFNGFKILL